MTTWTKLITNLNNQLSNKRTRLIRTSSNNRQVLINKDYYFNYQSNDYLGLSTHNSIINSVKESINQYGIGSTGAPSLSGYTEEHILLQNELANWLGFEQALLFASGYQMNSSLFKELVNSNVCVWMDKNCHASHIDGVLLSRARFKRFDNTEILQIKEYIQKNNDVLHLIITEGTYSMDGLNHTIPSLIELKHQFSDKILLVIDDAHGIGCMGNNGYGSLEALELKLKHIDILLGTFGKTFGSHGGFLCANKVITEYLQNSVRSQIFSTNIPPMIARSNRQALTILNSQEGIALRTKLIDNINYFKSYAKSCNLEVYNIEHNNSPIQLISCNSIEQVTNIYNSLYKNKILVGKIIYPTVPLNSPRIRISLNTHHTFDDINRLINQICKTIGNQ